MAGNTVTLVAVTVTSTGVIDDSTSLAVGDTAAATGISEDWLPVPNVVGVVVGPGSAIHHEDRPVTGETLEFDAKVVVAAVFPGSKIGKPVAVTKPGATTPETAVVTEP